MSPSYQSIVHSAKDQSLTTVIGCINYDARITCLLSEYHAKRWYKDKRVFNKIRLDSYYGLIKLSDFASNNTKDYGIPSLILYGTDDSQIHKNSICALVKRLGDKAVLRVFKDRPHLILQMKDQNTVYNLLNKWIENPVNSSKSDFINFCK